MREKLNFLVLIGLCMIIFTACGKESKFNEKQKKILADYIAQTVIEHSEGYETKLVDVSKSPFLLNEGEDDNIFSLVDNKVSDSADDEDSSVIKTGDSGTLNGNSDKDFEDTDDNKENVSKLQIATILGFKDGVEAYVSNKKILEEYASDSYVIYAEKNEKLVEVNFKIMNKTDSNIKVETSNNNVKYKLKVGGEIYYPLLTAIDNDLMYFEKNINAKKASSAVLLFGVENEHIKDKFVLEIENSDELASISLD